MSQITCPRCKKIVGDIEIVRFGGESEWIQCPYCRLIFKLGK